MCVELDTIAIRMRWVYYVARQSQNYSQSSASLAAKSVLTANHQITQVRPLFLNIAHLKLPLMTKVMYRHETQYQIKTQYAGAWKWNGKISFSFKKSKCKMVTFLTLKSLMDWVVLEFTGLFQKVGPTTATLLSPQRDIPRIVVCFYRHKCAEKK